MSATCSIQIDLAAPELPRLAAAVEEMAETEGWMPDLAFQIHLVLDEIGDNLVEHSAQAQSTYMMVTLDSQDQAVTIKVVDDGIAFDPTADAPAADVTSALEDRPVGGLGLHLIRTLMDKVDYRREDGRNILTLVKHRTP